MCVKTALQMEFVGYCLGKVCKQIEEGTWRRRFLWTPGNHPKSQPLLPWRLKCPASLTRLARTQSPPARTGSGCRNRYRAAKTLAPTFTGGECSLTIRLLSTIHARLID